MHIDIKANATKYIKEMENGNNKNCIRFFMSYVRVLFSSLLHYLIKLYFIL